MSTRPPVTIWMALPAYNEERSLPNLLERFVTLQPELEKTGAKLRVLVVDDGSTDGTIAAAERFQGRLALEVIPHGVNRNLGAGLRTGLSGALQRCGPDDLVATMDADNTHVGISCRPNPADCLTRRGYVTVTITTTVPLPLMPPVLQLHLPAGIPVKAVATEQVSRFWGSR